MSNTTDATPAPLAVGITKESKLRDVESLVIDRSKWVNGGSPDCMGSSKLLNASGNMCCLGFLALACGYSPEECIEVTNPRRLATETKWERGVGLIGSKFIDDAISINDGLGEQPSSRERRLTSLFRAQDIELTFVDTVSSCEGGNREDFSSPTS